jgi:hypothetical protein
MKLATLRRRAQTATVLRGHRMKWDWPAVDIRGMGGIDRWAQSGRCERCNMKVQLLTHPAPNEINIGGEAVAMTCEPIACGGIPIERS